MRKQNVNIFGITIICILLMLTMVSAVPPLSVEFTGNEGFLVEANVQDYYKINEGASVHIFVFNISNGAIITSDYASCRVELTDSNGTEVLSGFPTVEDDHFHMSRNSSIVSEGGVYGLTIICNDSVMGGYKTAFFEANNYGRGLTEEVSFNFNFGMIFLMILFISSLIGLFSIDNYVAKFTLYWVCHILFVVGTFSVWQFNHGFNIAYVGLAGIYKILFYVSVTAVFPMVILSMVWIFYIHLMNDEIKKLMNRGMDEDEAYNRARSKRKW